RRLMFSCTLPPPTQSSTLSLHDALPIFGFGKFLVAIISLALAVAAFEFLSGWQVMPTGWELAPVMDGLMIVAEICLFLMGAFTLDRKSTRLNSSHVSISYAVFCLKKKKL